MEDIRKGKMEFEQSYRKGVEFLDLTELTDVLGKPETKVNIQKQGRLDNGAEYLVVKIFYKHIPKTKQNEG